jgi:hypothetical protein
MRRERRDPLTIDMGRRCTMQWISHTKADDQASDDERRLSDVNIGC